VIRHYLNSRYCRYGRGPETYDCWGLVREARVTLFGKPLLASYGEIGGQMAREMTGAVNDTIQSHLKPCGPRLGAIAMGWRGRLCVHVGIVVQADGRKWVLETDSGTGPVLTCVRDFEARFVKVTYYDD
jgi:hypothetical protein